jgi:hypothetical protein
LAPVYSWKLLSVNRSSGRIFNPRVRVSTIEIRTIFMLPMFININEKDIAATEATDQVHALVPETHGEGKVGVGG